MENQHFNPQSFDPAMRLWQRRKWVAIGAFLLIFIPAMVFLWSLPQVYEATATLTIPGAGNAAQADTGSAAFGAPLAAVNEQVLSRNNLAKIITQLNLFPQQRQRLPATQLTGDMRQNITISPLQTKDSRGRSQAYAFTVTYRDWQPKTAAAVANRLAKSYQSMAGGMQASQASQTAKALEARIAEVSNKLDKQRAQIDAYQKKHLGELPQQQQIQLAAISRLDAHLQADQTSELVAMNRRDELLSQTAKSGGGDLAQLRQRLQDLRTTYTDQYPAVKQLKQRIAVLEAHKASADPAPSDPSSGPSSIDQVNATLGSIREDEKLTRQKIARYQKQLNMLPVTGQQLQALSQGYSETSGVYSTLLKRYEQARSTAATMDTADPPYQILEAATTFGGPVGPKRIRYAIVLLILCVLFGVAVAYIAEKRDTTFHSLEELRDFTSVPVLATVPYIRDGKLHPLQALRSKTTGAAVIVGVFVLSIVAYFIAYGGQAVSLALTHH